MRWAQNGLLGSWNQSKHAGKPAHAGVSSFFPLIFCWPGQASCGSLLPTGGLASLALFVAGLANSAGGQLPADVGVAVPTQLFQVCQERVPCLRVPGAYWFVISLVCVAILSCSEHFPKMKSDLVFQWPSCPTCFLFGRQAPIVPASNKFQERLISVDIAVAVGLASTAFYECSP